MDASFPVAAPLKAPFGVEKDTVVEIDMSGSICKALWSAFGKFRVI